jgi:short-subunit dehydrogenase
MTDDFSQRYGPWAVVLGASDGIGEAMARAFAARGANVVLLARRQALLDEVAGSLPTQTRAVSVDLTADDAMGQIADATDGLEVGLIAYCAGGDAVYEPFLDNPADTALGMVQRNCVVPVQVCHHFAGPMVERGRGGIIIVGSGAGLIGAPNMVAYAASKAFDMVLAEALWAELHDQGVDVLGLILGVTDTPSLRQLMVKRGLLADLDDPLPDAVSAEDTAEEAVAHLADGPTHFVSEQLRTGAPLLASLPRNDAVRMMIQLGDDAMGGNRG